MDKLVKCERLDDFGRGISYIDGKITFIPDFLPSEEALVCVDYEKSKYMMGKVIELKKESSFRICPKCPYDNCGCALKNLDYFKTLEFKKEKVQSILRRFGSINFEIKNIVASPSIYNYRNKITLKVRGGKLGYFKTGSNDLLEIDECLIASHNINKIIKVLKKEDLSNASEIVIKDMDGIMISIKGLINIENLKKYSDSIYINDSLVYGVENIISTLGDYKFYVSKDSFFQVNKEVTLKLYSKVLEYVGKGNKCLDLYSGTGTISLFLSKQFKEVIGVEINKEAVRCANLNKELNKVSNVKFLCGDANKLTKGLKCDSLVVDPARAGIMKDGIQNILDIKPKKMVYVSCDPVSLARDLKLLSDFYRVVDITLFDMFPWTYHVESVCLLELR